MGHEQFDVMQTLLHVMSGCEKHLHQGRYTWRHNSVLKVLASFLLPRGIGELYVDLEGFRSPSEVTGDSKRPDMLIVRPDGTLYLAELTVCYETNMPKNAQIKSNVMRLQLNILSHHLHA